MALCLSLAAFQVFTPGRIWVFGNSVPSKPSPYDLRTDVPRLPGPGIEQLQSLVRQYYPGLARHDAPARVTIGFMFDSTCKVVRHAAAFTPDSTSQDVLLRTVFPDSRVRGRRGGIADAVPPTEGRQVLVTWTVLPEQLDERS